MRALSARKLGEVEAVLERTREVKGWLEVRRSAAARARRSALFEAPAGGPAESGLALRVVKVAGGGCRR